jgi:type I restriction enzyme, S subunit
MVDLKDWQEINIGNDTTLKARIGWQGLTTGEYKDSGEYYLVTGTDFENGFVNWDTCHFVDKWRFDQDKNIQLKVNDVLITKDGTIGKAGFIDIIKLPTTLNSGVFVIRTNSNKLDQRYLYYIFTSEIFDEFLNRLTAGSTINHLYQKDFVHFTFKAPKLEEQKVIAKALSDTDELITSLEKLISKKEAIKQGTMQQLLTGKKRLSGFSGEWETYTIEEIAINLDNLRIPLNENQRSKMRGDIPYCGANGVVGTVNDYVIDDDILLMAEDGGYFDEWATRPIVYRMIGKCWVNNHAHILKAKENFSQDYLFYSLVHKDITKFLASGTRAKLNKSEMYKIEVFAPKNIAEQQEISQILSDMDNEIETLKQKLSKTKAIKDGIMSELLTGKTRLKVKDE